MVIVSYKHKFIYIKTYKTASTSIQILLGKYCGENDVLTPIEPVTTEVGRLYNKLAKNYEGFYSHMGAEEIQKRVGKDIWNQYFKFTFERNPWDKAVSFYHFFRKTKGLNISFDKWIQEWIKGKTRVSNYNLYTIKGKIAVDFIGKYENLKSDLNFVLNKLELQFDELPREKAGYRNDSKNYKSYYTEKTKKLIAKRNKKEIKLFGYNF